MRRSTRNILLAWWITTASFYIGFAAGRADGLVPVTVTPHAVVGPPCGPVYFPDTTC